MTVIRNSPVRRSPGAVAVVSVVLGLMIGGALLWILREERPVSSLIAVVLAALVAYGLIVLVLRRRYQPLAFDTSTGRVRMGGHTVALASVTTAQRSASWNVIGGSSVSYRFVSTEGPSVLVLVAGRPFRGLDEPGLGALRRFIELAPIAGPDDASAARQELRASDLLHDGHAVAVSSETLLAELDGLLGAPAAAAPGERTITQAEARQLAVQWNDDNGDAASTIAALPRGREIWRQVGRWGVLLASVAGILVAVTGVALVLIDEGGSVSGGYLAVGLGLPVTVVTALAAGFVLAVATDARNAQIRRAGRDWLAAGDDARRERGLASPFVDASIDGSNHTIGYAVIMGLIVAASAVLGSLVALSQRPSDVGPAVAVLAVGLAAAALSIWGRAVARRRKAAAIREYVGLAGLRIDPPTVTGDAAPLPDDPPERAD